MEDIGTFHICVGCNFFDEMAFPKPPSSGQESGEKWRRVVWLGIVTCFTGMAISRKSLDHVTIILEGKYSQPQAKIFMRLSESSSSEEPTTSHMDKHSDNQNPSPPSNHVAQYTAFAAWCIRNNL
jgi:hypothetical protein